MSEELAALTDAPQSEPATIEAPAAPVTETAPAEPEAPKIDVKDRHSVIAEAFKKASDGKLDDFRQKLRQDSRRGQHAALQPRREGKFAGPPQAQPHSQPQETQQRPMGQKPVAPAPQIGQNVAAPGAPQNTAAPVSTRPLPNSWEAKFADKWSKLDPEIQAQIEKREAQAYSGLEQYKERAAFAKDVQQALQPYMQTIQHLGATPVQAIQRLFNADHVLRYASPQQKQQYLLQIAHEYGVPLTQDAMQQQMQNYQQPQQYVHPAVLQEINNLRQQLQQVTQQTQIAPYMSEVERFAADPKYPHFETLRPVMAALIEKAASENRPMTLEQAYTEASWSLPEVREQLLAEQRRSAAQQQAAQVQASKNAAVQVRGAPATALPTQIDPSDRRSVIANALRAAAN